MIHFLDGPAAGVKLMLKRAPVLLRVTHHVMSGKWDALDQLDDQPDPDERIYVYRVAGPVSHCHIRCAEPAPSGWFVMGEYRVLPDQPEDRHTRATEDWRAWCTAWQTQLDAPG